MTKSEFLKKLTIELNRKNLADTADIIDEYEQHFAFKLADGYSEEEISAKLGDPKEIAAQYDTASTASTGGKKAIAVIGLGAADFFFGIFCVLLYTWEIIMGALIFAFGALSVCLIGRFGNLALFSLPEIPYHCSIILGVATAALTVLSVVGTVYFFGFIRQLMRSFGRFHRNALASASGRATLPSLPIYPQFSAKIKRRLRRTTVIAVTLFAICFIIGFVFCVITAGSFEFWHTWGWFGYAG